MVSQIIYLAFTKIMTTVDLWSCSPNKVESLESTLAGLSNRLLSEAHPVFGPVLKEFSVPMLTKKLDMFYTPHVLAKLSLTIGTEVDPLRDEDTIELMKTVRECCFNLVSAYANRGTITSVDTIQLYTYICKFKMLFTHPQYGACQSLYKMVLFKGLEFLHLHGVTPLFLVLCDLCPTLFAEDCYVIIKHPGIEKLQAFEDLIEGDWFFRNLLGKHSALWNRCVQSQLM